MRSAAKLVEAVVLGMLVACGGGGSTSPGGGATTTTTTGGSSTNAITVGNNTFTPNLTTVPTGTMVTWTWHSCSTDGYGNTQCVKHSVAFDDGQQSPLGQSSGSYSRTFNAPGTYTYHCAYHGTAMSGTVAVK